MSLHRASRSDGDGRLEGGWLNLGRARFVSVLLEMGKLIALRMARWARKGSNPPEYPHLEILVEEESVKVGDGFHLARWIIPAVTTFFAVACFLPLALTVHPGFWYGVGGCLGLGAIVGLVFHQLAQQISASQVRLRKRCMTLSGRMLGLNNLLGLREALSPEVAQVLDEAARLYLQSQSREPLPAQGGVWTDATLQARRSMDEAMAQMLELALPESAQAQEVELSKGWAEPLLVEMRATAALLSGPKPLEATHSVHTPLTNLAEARAQLERLSHAVQELDDPEAPPRVSVTD